MSYTNGNCLVAQSGGPTAVINSSAYGVIMEFMKNSDNSKVFIGVNGIEGIINEQVYNADKLSLEDLKTMKFLPSAALGSCRYKLKNFREAEEEYDKLFNIFNKYNIKYFFYIGGNDSMDAAQKISEYAVLMGYDIKIIGVPKTIDNDLVETDHCPGFGSTAKYACNTVMELWMDTRTYYSNSIMVVEVMGRDAGWIAASTGILSKAIPDINQLIYLPEVAFSKDKFLKDVSAAVKNNGKLMVVTSEGLKNHKGEYININDNCYEKDNFGHKQLGGIGKYLQSLIKENVEKRVKFTELGVSQRCAMHCISKTDLEEAELVGREAVRYSLEGNTGFMVSILRKDAPEYEVTTKLVELSKVCNAVKNVPLNYINDSQNGITKLMEDYVSPLILGEVNCLGNDGLMRYVNIRKKIGYEL